MRNSAEWKRSATEWDLNLCSPTVPKCVIMWSMSFLKAFGNCSLPTFAYEGKTEVPRMSEKPSGDSSGVRPQVLSFPRALSTLQIHLSSSSPSWWPLYAQISSQEYFLPHQTSGMSSHSRILQWAVANSCQSRVPDLPGLGSKAGCAWLGQLSAKLSRWTPWLCFLSCLLTRCVYKIWKVRSSLPHSPHAQNVNRDGRNYELDMIEGCMEHARKALTTNGRGCCSCCSHKPGKVPHLAAKFRIFRKNFKCTSVPIWPLRSLLSW